MAHARRAPRRSDARRDGANREAAGELRGVRLGLRGRGTWTFDNPGGSGAVEFDLSPDSASAEKAASDPRYREIAGDRIVSSDNALIRSLNIGVERLAIRLSEPRDQFECTGR